MSYRPRIYPHRSNYTAPRALWQTIDAAATEAGVDASHLVRAAILAAGPRVAPEVGTPHNRREATSRRALRLCSACAARIAGAPGTAAGALRALVADGLTRDWRAHLRRAEMGDAWREEVRG